MSVDGSGAGSLPPCAVCRTKVALYRCPRCHTCTCSLECCRAHKVKGASSSNNTITGNKKEVMCNGKRDRTQFCSLKGFTDSQLSSDYHFLEDVLKVSESSKRLYHGIVAGDSLEASKFGPGAKRARGPAKRIDLESISNKLPTHPLLQAKAGTSSIVTVLAHSVNDNLYAHEERHSDPEEGVINELLSDNKKGASAMPSRPQKTGEKAVDTLVRQAELKGVNLLRMPCGMMRRNSNTTKFNKKKGEISWKIELCFHLPNEVDEESKSFSSAEGDTNMTLPTHLMVESVMSESCTLSNELGKHLNVHPGNSKTRSRLRRFVNAPRDSLLLFIKRIPCSSAAPKYFKLGPNSTLAEALEGKTIIEFPTIHVVLDSDKERFPLFIEDYP